MNRGLARPLLALVVLASLVACSGKDAGTCMPSAGAGQAVATIDGTDWASDATWTSSAGTVHLNTSPVDGWFLSVVAQTTTDGGEAGSAIDDASFPAEVTLKSGSEGGFATAYPDAGNSFATSKAAGGSITFASEDAGVLSGCFSFEASDGTDTIQVEDGSFAATGG